MRILYFSDNCSVHNRRFLEKLAESGHEVWFLNPTQGSASPEWLPEGVQWVQTKALLAQNARPSVWAEFLPEFQSVLKKIQPDLVHAGPVQSTAYVAALSGFHPLLVMSWGSDMLFHADRNEECMQATQMALQGAAGFFCDCNAVRKRAGQLADLSQCQTVQFPWGIEQGSFSPKGFGVEVALGSSSDSKVFISTRSWEEIYDPEVLLTAFQKAYARDPRLRLLLLGGGSMAAKVHVLIARNRLEQVVLTPGSIPPHDLPQWFRSAMAYVSCARCDGTSISLLEAMATGLPALVTDISSNREWIKEPENGCLAPTGDAEKFAVKMLQIANLTQEQRDTISQQNCRIVAERADWDKNFPQLLAMYERLAFVSAGH